MIDSIIEQSAPITLLEHFASSVVNSGTNEDELSNSVKEENSITPEETVWWQVAEKEENSITKMDVHICTICSKKFSSDRAMRQHHRDKHAHEEVSNYWKDDEAKQEGGLHLNSLLAFLGIIIIFANFAIPLTILRYLLPSENGLFTRLGFLAWIILCCYINWRIIKWAANKYENVEITSSIQYRGP
mgnify:CR=1 FL=1